MNEVTPRFKVKRKADPKHLARVRKLPCVVCGRSPCDANHIEGDKGGTVKPDDDLTFPLCRQHHIEFHHMGFTRWEEIHGSQMDHVAATLRRLANPIVN